MEESRVFCHSLDPEVLLEDPVAEEDDLDPSRGRHGVGAVGQYLNDVRTKKADERKGGCVIATVARWGKGPKVQSLSDIVTTLGSQHPIFQYLSQGKKAHLVSSHKIYGKIVTISNFF